MIRGLYTVLYRYTTSMARSRWHIYEGNRFVVHASYLFVFGDSSLWAISLIFCFLHLAVWRHLISHSIHLHVISLLRFLPTLSLHSEGRVELLIRFFPSFFMYLIPRASCFRPWWTSFPGVDWSTRRAIDSTVRIAPVTRSPYLPAAFRPTK